MQSKNHSQESQTAFEQYLASGRNQLRRNEVEKQVGAFAMNVVDGHRDRFAFTLPRGHGTTTLLIYAAQFILQHKPIGKMLFVTKFPEEISEGITRNLAAQGHGIETVYRVTQKGSHTVWFLSSSVRFITPEEFHNGTISDYGVVIVDAFPGQCECVPDAPSNAAQLNAKFMEKIPSNRAALIGCGYEARSAFKLLPETEPSQKALAEVERRFIKQAVAGECIHELAQYSDGVYRANAPVRMADEFLRVAPAADLGQHPMNMVIVTDNSKYPELVKKIEQLRATDKRLEKSFDDGGVATVFTGRRASVMVMAADGLDYLPLHSEPWIDVLVVASNFTGTLTASSIVDAGYRGNHIRKLLTYRLSHRLGRHEAFHTSIFVATHFSKAPSPATVSAGPAFISALPNFAKSNEEIIQHHMSLFGIPASIMHPPGFYFHPPKPELPKIESKSIEPKTLVTVPSVYDAEPTYRYGMAEPSFNLIDLVVAIGVTVPLIVEGAVSSAYQFTKRRMSAAVDFVTRVRGKVSMFSKTGFAFIAGAIFCLWGPTILQRIPTPTPVPVSNHSSVMLTSHDLYEAPPLWTEVTIVGPVEVLRKEVLNYETREYETKEVKTLRGDTTYQIVESEDGKRFRVEGIWGDLGDTCKLPTTELVATQRTGIASWFSKTQ